MPVIEKTSHDLRIIKFYSHKDFVKNIPASIAKGSKENQRTFRSSWSNVVAILQQSERGDLETKFGNKSVFSYTNTKNPTKISSCNM